MNTLKEIANELKIKDKFLIVSHASPDGDTLGSATALIRALRKLGKKANFACADELHKRFSYLFDGLENEEFEIENYVTVDVADPNLLGALKDTFKIDIAIDHHRSNKVTADCIYVDSDSAANAMIIYELIEELGVEICPKIANSLYTGIATDTGCFKHPNTTPKTHNMAAKLFELGANFTMINRLMFDTKTLASLRIESEVFSKMEFFYDEKIICAIISQEMLEKTGADSEDVNAIPNLIRSVEGVYVGMTLKEKKDGLWKASIRAIDPIDASAICQKVGGGGHKGAGGCALTHDFEESKSMLVNACLEHFKEINF